MFCRKKYTPYGMARILIIHLYKEVQVWITLYITAYEYGYTHHVDKLVYLLCLLRLLTGLIIIYQTLSGSAETMIIKQTH